MNNLRNYKGCIYNLLYIQYNEKFAREEFFYQDIKYPVLYNVKNGYFQVDKTILENINRTISSDIETFNNGIYEEMTQYNKVAEENNTPKRTYEVYIYYDIAFNKNHIISILLNLEALTSDASNASDTASSSIQYNELYTYNIDLLNGNYLPLKSLFLPNVNYISLLSNYANDQVQETPNLFYPDTVIEIPDSQSFYITDKGIVLYFDVEEIASKDAGITKFLIPFEEFSPYINPRIYCVPENVMRRNMKNKKKFRR